MNTRVLTIARKEFAAFLNSAVAYTIIVPFLLISTFLYLRIALSSGEANMRPFFDLLPWFLLLVAPALSMRLLTEEYRNNTLELLFAHPLSEFQIVLGKFLGALGFFGLMLLSTIGMPLSVVVFSNADPGQILGQYLGAFFLGGSFLAIGLAASAYVRNSISSFLLGAAVSFILLIIGLDFIAVLFPYPFSRIVADISILNRSESISRGVLDIRDLTYFLTLIGVCLTVTTSKLAERKFAENPAEKRKLTAALTLLVTIGVLVNVALLSFPVRLDLTAGRLFTLSPGTRQALTSLPDLVTIRLFASRDLPAEMQGAYRDVYDTLRDYQRLSNKVQVVVKDPATDLEAAGQARSAGIQEIQFNKVGSGKFEVQSGFLGLSIHYGDKSETIPFISSTGDLEYQLTRRIRKLTSGQAQTIGLLTTGFAQYNLFRQVLSTQYEISDLTEGDAAKLPGLTALIVLDSGEMESTAGAMVSEYLRSDGSILYLGSGVAVNGQMLSADKSKSGLGAAFSDFGITLNQDMAYDTQLGELLAFGEDVQRYIAPYPFWIRSLPIDTTLPILTNVKTVLLPWPSTLTVNPTEGVTVNRLLGTTTNGGVEKESFSISPESIGQLAGDSQHILAAAAQKGSAKLVMVSTDRVADDQFLTNSPDNTAFLSNAVDWLASDETMAAIPSKSGGRAVFAFTNPYQLLFVQYGNLFLPPLLVIVFAVLHLRRRKRLTMRTYRTT